MVKILRDEDRCIGCNECVIICPQSQDREKPVLVKKENGEPPEVLNPENCIQCMTCYNTCRSMAISFEDFHEVPRLVRDSELEESVLKII